MPRAVSGVVSRRRRKVWLKRAKGNYSGRRKLFKNAKETSMRALRYAYRDRRQRKREFRALWIARLNAAARQHGLTYKTLITGLKQAGVGLDRKVLADLAVQSPDAFSVLANMATEALGKPLTAATT
ncbi:MAG: 50S ribosomal protein L20 [Candidatus Sumerlaeia bacterium]|nr:50S ribosomal protein L20 [Candidatus Sumerlaeia bacterium]